MNDNEINIAIAEACGFEVFLSDMQSGLDIVKGGVRIPLPSYTTDLNAMHEAENTLRVAPGTYQPGGRGHYSQLMADLCGTEGRVFATARQRAEAFLRTMGKWKN